MQVSSKTLNWTIGCKESKYRQSLWHLKIIDTLLLFLADETILKILINYLSNLSIKKYQTLRTISEGRCFTRSAFEPIVMIFIIELCLDLGITGLKIASKTNLELGP